MAIVFVSPKKRQRVFFTVLAILAVVVLTAVFSFFFILQVETIPRLPAVQEMAMTPKITIDFSTIDSEQVKKLEPFLAVKTEFSYTAINQLNQQVSGKILSENQQEAISILEGEGLQVLAIQEVIAGREEPFTTY